MTAPAPENIEKDGRQVRLLIGILFLFFSFLLTVLLVGLGSERGWRLLIIFPWVICLLNLFQCRNGIDVIMAIRGFEDTTEGRRKIIDPQRILLVQTLARRITRQALLLAALLTLLGLLIPPLDLERFSDLYYASP
jgi:hypothetical protein